MSGKVISVPNTPHDCEGLPPTYEHPRGTIWECDDCGQQYVVVYGAQYNESYAAWRKLTPQNRNGDDR